MKKLLFVIVALVITNSAFSQGFKFGIKAGGNLSNMSTMATSVSGLFSADMDVFKNDGMKIGFHTGVFANISLGSMFGVQPELLFSMQGGQQKLNPEVGDFFGDEIPADTDVEFNYVFDYINLPILFEFKPILGLGILVGPQVGFNIYKSQTTTLKLGGRTISEETVKNAEMEDFIKEEVGENPYKKLDLALVFGVQYSIWKIHVGVRYNLGLTSSFSAERSAEGMKMTATGMKNGVLQFSVGYSLF